MTLEPKKVFQYLYSFSHTATVSIINEHKMSGETYVLRKEKIRNA